MSKSQREMAEIVILAVTGHEANSDTPVSISAAQLTEVVNTLTDKAMEGETTFKDTESNRVKLADRSKMLKYIKGQTNDTLRKSKKLNGNTEYATKNPGSRRGSGDAVVKAIKLTMSRVVGDEVATNKCLDELAKRYEAIRLESQKAVAVNVEDLPEALRQYV